MSHYHIERENLHEFLFRWVWPLVNKSEYAERLGYEYQKRIQQLLKDD